MSTNTTSDRVTHGLLLATVALLAVIAIQLSALVPSTLPAARAQIPDTARQRQDILGEARKTNDLLTGILEHLRTRPVKVVIEDTDKARGPATRSARQP